MESGFQFRQFYRLGFRVFAFDSSQLFGEFVSALRQLLGDLDYQFQVKVASSVACRRNTFFANTKHLPVLRTRRYVDPYLFALDRLDGYLAAEHRHGSADRQSAIQIISVALEILMRGDMNENEKISRGAAVGAYIALPRNGHALAILDPGRDREFDFLFLLSKSGAAAFAAGALDYISFTPAGRTGLCDGKEPGGTANLTRTLTGGADALARAVGASRTAAGLARVVFRIRNFDRRSENGLFETQLEIISEVRAPGCTLAISGTPRTAPEERIEDIRKIAETAEYILETLENTGKILRPSARHPFDACETELVIGLASLVVAEHFVGLGGLLEPFFGCLIPRILVRMVLYGETAVRFLYVFLRRILWNAEDFVVIALSHREPLSSSPRRV